MKAAGFTEITKRVGIHEGTTKIYINYVAIADITKIDEGFYEQINRKSIAVDGISMPTLFCENDDVSRTESAERYVK